MFISETILILKRFADVSLVNTGMKISLGDFFTFQVVVDKS